MNNVQFYSLNAVYISHLNDSLLPEAKRYAMKYAADKCAAILGQKSTNF